MMRKFLSDGKKINDTTFDSLKFSKQLTARKLCENIRESLKKVVSFISVKLLRLIYILPIRFYQLSISPMLGPSKCRFQPTCSQYTIEAIQEWGILKGTWLGIKRISKCHPWGPHGHDPVPKKEGGIGSGNQNQNIN